jgi:glycylpeptide N-tetradecanoyltransferase
LLRNYLSKFEFRPVFDEDEVRHWIKPTSDVVSTFVVQVKLINTKELGKITDFVSFYHLPSSVSGSKFHKEIKACYLFYYVPKFLGTDKERNINLVNDALIMAANLGFDVMNCLELLNNGDVLEQLKFGKGDGELHFYMYIIVEFRYNYRCMDVSPNKMALVML